MSSNEKAAGVSIIAGMEKPAVVKAKGAVNKPVVSVEKPTGEQQLVKVETKKPAQTTAKAQTQTKQVEAAPPPAVTPSIPAKAKCDFQIDFLEEEKRIPLKGSESVGHDYVMSFNVSQERPEDRAAKKKKKKLQDVMPWVGSMRFVDDLNNVVVNFLDELRQRDTPFRVRVKAMDNAGNVLEMFMFKGVRITTWPNSYYFNIEVSGERTLEVSFKADTMVRKSVIPADE